METPVSSDKCTCLIAGWCERRQKRVPNLHWKKCQAGMVYHLDNLYSQPISPQAPATRLQAPKVAVKPSRSKIGDLLKDIIKRETEYEIPCSDCKAEVERLNTMTSKEVLAEIDSIAQKIFERSKDKAQKWTQKLAIKFAPEFVKHEIRKWIKEACTLNDNSITEVSMKWSYGITTVPSRAKDLFPKTLESLMNAGFDSPRIFVDGCRPSEADAIYGKYGFPVTPHYPTIRTAGTWMLSLYEMYVRNPWADRYAVFQDDFVTIRNLRKYLERVPYPSQGYCNLYTFPSNQSIAPADHKGWYASNQLGRGAVALVFSAEAVRILLGTKYMPERFTDVHRGHKALDGGVVSALKAVGWKEYVHNPSLVQHTGDYSTMGNRPHQKAVSFPGESFDALSLLT